MRALFIAIAALATIAWPAFAEPARHDAPKPNDAKAQQPRASLVLASADPVHSSPPVGAQSLTAPAKRALPRVTTCRCGDQEVGPDSEDQ